MGHLTILTFLAIVIGTNGAWVKVWEDNFDGKHLNDSDWLYEEGCDGWGNDELECYTAHRNENVRVENGHLVIHVNVENFKGKHYTSARLNTKHAWTYGKFETRAKLPQGKHLWPAIWMMPKNDSKYGDYPASGEIDIMELRGGKPHTIEATIHYGGAEPNFVSTGSDERKFPHDFTADFHTFTLEWDQNEVTWYVDNEQYFKINIHRSMWSGKGRNPYWKDGQPFDSPFYMILNIAVGGNFFPADEYGHLTEDEARHWPKPTMEVDYVRVYQMH